MRITLTALTPTGPRDLVVSGDDGLTVGQVAAELRGAVWPREQLAEVIPLPGADLGSWADRRQAQRQGRDAVGQRPPAGPRRRGGRDAARRRGRRGRPADRPGDHAGRAARARSRSGPWAARSRARCGGWGWARRRWAARGTAMCRCPDLTARPRRADHRQPGVPRGGRDARAARAAPARPLLLDGEEVTAARRWPPGALLEIGAHVLELALPEPPDAHLSPAERRRPGLQPAAPAVAGQAARAASRCRPSPSAARRSASSCWPRSSRWSSGLVMVKAMHSAIYALFMLMSPVMIVGQWHQRPAARPDVLPARRCASTGSKLAELEPTMAGGAGHRRGGAAERRA